MKQKEVEVIQVLQLLFKLSLIKKYLWKNYHSENLIVNWKSYTYIFIRK